MKDQKESTQAPAAAPLNTATPVKHQPTLVKVPRKFEIFIEEMNERDDGQTEWRPVNMGHEGGKPVIITVNSPKELNDMQELYRQSGQRFRIVREIDPPTPADIQRMAAEQGIIPPQPPKPAVQAQPVVQQPVVQQPLVQQAVMQQPVQPQVKAKPRFVTIGDVQIKYDGDKVYQKQWIKLNANEAANFRVVNDSNNKIVPLTGKHVEIKKWVLVEDQDDDRGMGDIDEQV